MSSWRLFPILFALCATGQIYAAELTGRVVGVHDGDTISVLDSGNVQHKVRLAGIDAPELKQAFGTRSKQNLSNLVYGKEVTVKWTKRDRYGRIVGTIFWNTPYLDCEPAKECTPSPNYQQIVAGMAWYYRQYEKELSADNRAAYDFAERRARDAKAGLWTEERPVPPWEWRRYR